MIPKASPLRQSCPKGRPKTGLFMIRPYISQPWQHIFGCSSGDSKHSSTFPDLRGVRRTLAGPNNCCLPQGHRDRGCRVSVRQPQPRPRLPRPGTVITCARHPSKVGQGSLTLIETQLIGKALLEWVGVPCQVRCLPSL